MTSPRTARPFVLKRGAAASLLATAALVATPALVAVPAHAAPAAVKVTAKASKATGAVGTTVKISGKVGGRSAKAKVVLQRRSGGKWVTVKAGRVKATKKYAVTTKVRAGATTYRVKVKGNGKVRTSYSRSLKVTGKKKAAAQVSVQVRRILADTNAFRKANGKKALKLDAAMSKVATSWSSRMGKQRFFEHNPSYSTQIPAGWTRAGENIAAGQSYTTVVDAWINSPGHRANLLGDFTHIGIGYVNVPGSPYGQYYTQNFAKYSSR